MRLQPLQRRRQIQDRLGPCAHDDDGRLGELGEVGRNISGEKSSIGNSQFAIRNSQFGAVDAADAARREDLDAGAVRGPGGRGDGCRAIELARYDNRQIAAADLAHVRRCRQVLDLVAAQTDDDLAGDDADRGRRCAALADDLLQSQRQPQVVRVG